MFEGASQLGWLDNRQKHAMSETLEFPRIKPTLKDWVGYDRDAISSLVDNSVSLSPFRKKNTLKPISNF